MLFNLYEEKGLLFNTNFKEAEGAYAAYRGDLVLTLGEVGDEQGHRKPPTATIKNTVVLAENGKITFYAGSLDDLAELPKIMAHYQDDLAPDAQLFIFVVNLAKPLVIDYAGFRIKAIAMQEGLLWNELLDMASLEKGDFKGQSPVEKIATVAKALKGYTLKADTVDFPTALTRIVADLKRAGRGPV